MTTDRVQRLKARLFKTDDRALFMEHMEIIQRCAREYAEESAGIRFGHTLRDLLSNISIVIEEDDLILGRVREVVPTEEQERWFEENKRDYFRVPWFLTDGHLTLSWERLLEEGLRGIRRRAKIGLETHQGEGACSLSKADFWQGTILCCDAIEAYALRYAERAETLARAASSGECQRELVELARICRRVPAHPARTFHEAVQSIWLVDLLLHTVVGARDFALGRLDQYLYPFYQHDLAAGRIIPEGAQELIECLYIKCSEIIGYGDQANRETRKRSLCQDSVQYVVLGGQTPDGRNAVNPLSTICLKAGYLQLKQPTCLFSIAKLPTHRTPGGGTNLRLHPSAVQGEAGLQALSSLLKTYFGLGGQHLQLNILDSAVLKRAQQHPEEYRTLSVRVVGYSAYFCALTQEVQDDIIRRTEHTR